MSLSDLSNITGGATDISAFSAARNRGMQPKVSDPYLTGYFYVMFTKVPTFIDPNTVQAFRVAHNSVTLPDITLNTTEIVTGFGGAGKVSYATSVDKGTDFSIKFTEMSGLPIINSIAQWVQTIRDFNTGLSSLENYSLPAYSGEVLVVMTKPVLNDVKGEQVGGNFIEKAFFFTEVFPTNVPFSGLNQDITASDKVEPEITFKHAGFYHGQKVNEFAAAKLTDLMGDSMLTFKPE